SVAPQKAAGFLGIIDRPPPLASSKVLLRPQKKHFYPHPSQLCLSPGSDSRPGDGDCGVQRPDSPSHFLMVTSVSCKGNMRDREVERKNIRSLFVGVFTRALAVM
ncbi:hypothetical protein KUCAC02_020951, partial [Chaenocephalus aceratus]